MTFAPYLHILTDLFAVSFRVVPHYLLVNVDYGVGFVDVDVVLSLNMRPCAVDPLASPPTMVVYPPVTPVAVAVQPDADAEPRAEGDESVAGRRPFDIHDLGIVYRDINYFGLRRNDPDVSIIDNHLLLRAGKQVAGSARVLTQELDRVHDVIGLVDERLSQGNGPVVFLVHHVEHVGIVRHSLDADIPVLTVNLGISSVLVDIPRGFIDLVDKGCGRQNLSNQGVGIERDGCDQIFQFIHAEQGFAVLRFLAVIGLVAVVGTRRVPCGE